MPRRLAVARHAGGRRRSLGSARSPVGAAITILALSRPTGSSAAGSPQAFGTAAAAAPARPAPPPAPTVQAATAAAQHPVMPPVTPPAPRPRHAGQTGAARSQVAETPRRGMTSTRRDQST